MLAEEPAAPDWLEPVNEIRRIPRGRRSGRGIRIHMDHQPTPSRSVANVAWAGVWLVLFVLQLTVEPRARSGGASPSLLIMMACADVLLLVIPIWTLFPRAGLARRHHRAPGELLIAGGWVAALVAGTLHAGSPVLLAAELSTEPVYTAALWVRRIFQLLVAPLAVIALAIISIKDLRARSWPVKAELTIIPIVLLLWIWLARPQSP